MNRWPIKLVIVIVALPASNVLAVAFGITGIRDMGSTIEQLRFGVQGADGTVIDVIDRPYSLEFATVGALL
jgi:hypothetical protein